MISQNPAAANLRFRRGVEELFKHKPRHPVLTPHQSPILALHGAWGSKDQWGDLQEIAGDRVRNFDLRGHGSDDRPLDGVSINDYALDIMGHLLEIKERCHVIAHSMSGLSALVAENHFSSPFKSLVLLTPTPGGNFAKEIPLRFRFIKYIFPMMLGKRYEPRDSDKRFIAGDSNVVLGAESGLATWESLKGKYVVRPRCPTLVVAAKRDQFFPIGLERKYAEHLGAEILEVDTDHFVHQSRHSGEILQSILKWCERHEHR